MITKNGDHYELSCDICGDFAYEYFGTHKEAVEYKRTEGWKAQRSGDDWEDVCPECVNSK